MMPTSSALSRRSALRLAGAASLLALSSGARAQTAPAGAARLSVLTSFTILADMAREVAGGGEDNRLAQIESLLRPGAEVHDYQPTPGDLLRARSAKLVLWNGLGLERWLERFAAAVTDARSVTLTARIEPIPISSGDYGGRPNPHAWMSPTNGILYVEAIRDALAEADPANAESYRRNAEAYAARIRALDAPLRERLSRLPPERRWLVTSEGAFSYLARDYGLRELYLWPINSDEQGTPQQVRRVIDAVRRERIPVVFSESTISDRAAKRVAAETGARYGGVLYVDSLSAPDGPVPTYLKLLEVTVDTIARGLEA